MSKKKRKPRKSKSAVCQLKSGFSGTFATSTQTIGSVHGCMRRALLPAHETRRLALLDEKDIQDMAARINSAVSTMAEARMFVFRAVEIIILDKLLGGSEGENGSEALGAVAGEEDAEATFDVLELILEKNAGTAIVKHLFSLILNGKIESGPPTVKQELKAAKEMSMVAFHRLCQILPGFQPVEKDSICLGRLVVDAAAEFSLQLRKHFRDMPFTIGRRQEAPPVGGGQSTPDTALEERINPGEDDEEDGQDKEIEDGDNEDDPKMQFADQHIRRWWKEARSFPPSMRPVFCLRHKFSDPFITSEERALPKPNPASAAALMIMTAKEASKHGELIRILFYGEPNEIKRSRSVQQTSYGRRSTTMDTLANNYPTIFAPTVLHSYLDNCFSFSNYAKDCKEKGVTCNRSPPPLPTSHIPQDPTQHPQRFALSNIFTTSGKELHVTCYDTAKPYRSRTAYVPIYRIENRFPTLESILREFGVSSVEDTDILGVDPGEANPFAEFCGSVSTPKAVEIKVCLIRPQ
ncbi:hypothetical protein BGZ89_001946 [Linnemannia elongata]|nr:hypothetical protein BGZ89_001946 [Linnemannia elongata]